MMERLLFNDKSQQYSPTETSIHTARYQVAKQWVEGKRVLDIACGEGYGAWLLKLWGAKSVTAIDISQEAIYNAQKNFSSTDIEFICGDANSLDLDKDFDLIISIETIEHLTEPSIYLHELKKLTTEKGIIIISCPNDYWYWSESESNPYHNKKYSLQDFSNECESVLGKAAFWLIGSNIFGYGNYLYEPESNSIEWHKKSLSPIDIISLASSSTLMCHNLKDNLPNATQSLYYIGIWGVNDKPIISGTFFPVEPLKKNIQDIDTSFNALNKYVHELEQGFSTLTNNEKTLREYINSLEYAVDILKKDNEHYRQSEKIVINATPENDKRSLIHNNIHSHNYYLLKKYCNNKTILDIGCGQGEGCSLLLEFGAAKITGVDLNISYIEKAKENYQNENINFLVGNAEQIDNLFDNEKFDIIIIHQTLEYIVDKVECLRSVKNILSPDGICVISCVNLQKIEEGILALAPYSNEQFINDVSLIFGDKIRIFKSYPTYGIAHTEINNLCYEIETPEELDDKTMLSCTIVYDLSNTIQPSAYLNIVNVQKWEKMIAHNYASEIKKEKLIFELQQRALLTQGLIIENQLLKEQIEKLSLSKSTQSFCKKIFKRLRRNNFFEKMT